MNPSSGPEVIWSTGINDEMLVNDNEPHDTLKWLHTQCYRVLYRGHVCKPSQRGKAMQEQLHLKTAIFSHEKDDLPQVGLKPTTYSMNNQVYYKRKEGKRSVHRASA